MPLRSRLHLCQAYEDMSGTKLKSPRVRGSWWDRILLLTRQAQKKEDERQAAEQRKRERLLKAVMAMTLLCSGIYFASYSWLLSAVREWQSSHVIPCCCPSGHCVALPWIGLWTLACTTFVTFFFLLAIGSCRSAFAFLSCAQRRPVMVLNSW